MNSTVSEKGQITIPKKLREQLGIGAGCVLTFEERQGELIAHKKESDDPTNKWKGRYTLPKKMTTDNYMNLIRER